MIKKNFQLNDRVRLVRIGGPLAGATGLVKGRSFTNVFDSYIVLLDQEFLPAYTYTDREPYNVEAIDLTESCLELVNE